MASACCREGSATLSIVSNIVNSFYLPTENIDYNETKLPRQMTEGMIAMNGNIQPSIHTFLSH